MGPEEAVPTRGSAKDVSCSRQVLKALQQKDKLFRLFFEKAGIGIVLTDDQGRFLDVNPAMARLLGYTRAQMRRMDFLQITHPADLDATLRLFGDLKAGKVETSQMEKRYIHRNGTGIWARVIVSCKRDFEGVPLLFIVMVEDIAEQKEVLEAIRKSEQRYRLLAENISDVIWTKDLNGKNTYLSPSYQVLTGFDAQEALGLSVEQVMAPSSAQLYRTKVAEQLELENLKPMDPSRSWTLEAELLRKDGSTFWAEVKITFLLDSRGCPIGTLGVTRDISERRLLEKQLIQAQKMEAVARLAGGVAHDFNNFLMAIIGFEEIIMTTLSEDNPLRLYARDIMLAAERTSAVTRQLLAFSRRQILQPQILDLNNLLSDMERMLRRLIQEDIELDLVLEPDLGNIKADPGQIEQVIMNLVINAKDALPKGGKVCIRTARIYLDAAYAHEHPEVQPGFYIKLTLADDGVGMDAEIQEHIFEPFFSTKEREGTGLGLASVYGIIKQSGGHIAVSSQVGKGSIFSIYLPRILETELPKKEGPSFAELQGRETILVAEDEDILRELICKSLQSYGFQVLEARNGQEALQVAEEFEGPIHLLLTDVVMPGIGGNELASRLEKFHPGIKRLYMSGHPENALIQHGLLMEIGAPFIQKPCRITKLTQKVHEVLTPPAEG